MPKSAKTIFHTTEKSNFILNMTPESYWQFNLKICRSFLILMPLFSLVLEFVRMYSVPGMALTITGVFAMVFVFIGFMKSETPKKLFLPAGLIGAMVVWGCVSLYNSYFYSISLFGADGRSEGLLSVVFYGCFFLLGAQLGTDGNRLKLLHGMLYMGLAECAWGLLQALPIGLPSYYQNLEPILLFRIFLPSGVTGSPIFLAILLVMLLVPSLLGSIFAEQKKSLYLICAVIFALFAVRTQCLAGLCGTALSIVLALVLSLWKKGGKKAILPVCAALAGLVLGIGWILAAPSLNGTYSNAAAEDTLSQQHILYDGAIMWTDGSYRLSTSGYWTNGSLNPQGDVDITSLGDVYRYRWTGTAAIIRQFPLVGSGPDNLVYPQLFQAIGVLQNPNVFDRAYNHYLQLAGTMGIPMLLLFLTLMVLTVVQGGKAAAKGSWLQAGIFGGVIVYLLVMLIGASSVTVTPLFWMLAGCCWQTEEN